MTAFNNNNNHNENLTVELQRYRDRQQKQENCWLPKRLHCTNIKVMVDKTIVKWIRTNALEIRVKKIFPLLRRTHEQKSKYREPTNQWKKNTNLVVVTQKKDERKQWQKLTQWEANRSNHSLANTEIYFSLCFSNSLR